MPTKTESNPKGETPNEPRGFGEHSRGLAGEYAHEQGWRLNEEERRHEPAGHQEIDGGTDYDYGARDFGDEPTDTSAATVEEVAAATRTLNKTR